MTKDLVTIECYSKNHRLIFEPPSHVIKTLVLVLGDHELEWAL